MDFSRLAGGAAPKPPTGGQLSPEQEAQITAFMKNMMESCPFKMVLSGTLGFAMGGAIGLFMSSMRYDTPMGGLPAGIKLPEGKTIYDLPLRQQLRISMKDMRQSMASSAKNFGKIGAMFSVTECCIEGLRGKNDIWNGIVGGGVTGGILARNAGPQAVAFGAVGFAAFSAGIEWYMRSGDTERRYPPI